MAALHACSDGDVFDESVSFVGVSAGSDGLLICIIVPAGSSMSDLLM